MFSNAVQSTPKLAATESIVIAAPKDYRWVRIACLITLVSCGELAALATVLYFRPTLGSQHLQMPVIFVLGSLSMVVNAFKGWVAGGVINLHRFSKRGVRALTAFAVNTLASWIHVPVSVGVQSAVLRMSFELFVAATALRMIYLFYRVDKRTLFWLVPLLIWLPLTLYFSFSEVLSPPRKLPPAAASPAQCACNAPPSPATLFQPRSAAAAVSSARPLPTAARPNT